MAGLGFKDFAVGEVLTANDVDGYLMQQTVMRFADAGARGSALGTATGTAVPLAEGMVSYLDDTNIVEVYAGAVWRSVGGILQVQTTSTTGTFSTSSTSFTAWTGLSVSITPRSTASTVLLMLNAPRVGTNTLGAQQQMRLKRDSTAVFTPAEASSSAVERENSMSIIFVDSPASASAITYSAEVNTNAGTCSFFGGSITAIEVA